MEPTDSTSMCVCIPAYICAYLFFILFLHDNHLMNCSTQEKLFMLPQGTHHFPGLYSRYLCVFLSPIRPFQVATVCNSSSYIPQ